MALGNLGNEGQARARGRRSANLIKVGAGIFEGSAAIMAFTKIIPLEVVVPGVITIALGTWVFLAERRARANAQQLRRVDEQYGRLYSLFETSWEYSASATDPCFWDGKNYAIREFVAQRPTRFLEWSIVRRSDADGDFGGAAVLSFSGTRSGAGTCRALPFHYNSTAKLAFRVEFDPPLTYAERARVEFCVLVPNYKPASLTGLQAKAAPTFPTPGHAEYSKTDVSYPIERFVKRVSIPKSLGSSQHGLQVYRGYFSEDREVEELQRNGNYTLASAIVNGQDSWVMTIDRADPLIKATYRIHWSLP
ncbi:hypothetical protein [Gordonia sp. AC31]|uniref:hypothetical protein n=1 Tax=Gordonia sp. AC31 TaxID=2962571 RepID=UPI0028821E94|nr:hypothetical protein [Gordonia sp. AC31]MDT0223836.1 hypothetical protein [Gordonia sp. AC31]